MIFFQLKRLLVGILFHNLRHPYIPLHFEEKICPLFPLTFLAHAHPHPFRAAELWGVGAAARMTYKSGITHALSTEDPPKVT